MIELYYNLFEKFSVFKFLEEMEMNTDSLYQAVAHDWLEDCIKPNKREVWNNIRMNDCGKTFAADSSNTLFLALAVPNISNMINESLDFLRRSLVALK